MMTESYMHKWVGGLIIYSWAESLIFGVLSVKLYLQNMTTIIDDPNPMQYVNSLHWRSSKHYD